MSIQTQNTWKVPCRVLMHSLLLYQESYLFAGLTCFISHITSTTCAYHMHKLPMKYSLFIINLPCCYMYLATEESSEADILKTISSKILLRTLGCNFFITFLMEQTSHKQVVNFRKLGPKTTLQARYLNRIQPKF